MLINGETLPPVSHKKLKRAKKSKTTDSQIRKPIRQNRQSRPMQAKSEPDPQRDQREPRIAKKEPHKVKTESRNRGYHPRKIELYLF